MPIPLHASISKTKATTYYYNVRPSEKGIGDCEYNSKSLTLAALLVFQNWAMLKIEFVYF